MKSGIFVCLLFWGICIAEKNVYFVSTFCQSDVNANGNDITDSTSYLASLNLVDHKIDTLFKFYSTPFARLGVNEKLKLVVIQNSPFGGAWSTPSQVSIYSFDQKKLLFQYTLDTTSVGNNSIAGLQINNFGEPELITVGFLKFSSSKKYVFQKINLVTKSKSVPKPDELYRSGFPNPYYVFQHAPWVRIYNDSVFLFNSFHDDSIFLKRITNAPKKWFGDTLNYGLRYWDDTLLVIGSNYSSRSDTATKLKHYYFNKDRLVEKFWYQKDLGKGSQVFNQFIVIKSASSSNLVEKYRVFNSMNGTWSTFQTPRNGSQLEAYNGSTFVLKKDSCLTVVDLIPNSSLYKEHPKICSEMFNHAPHVFFGNATKKCQGCKYGY